MPNKSYPRLSELISDTDFPGILAPATGQLSTLLSKIFYRNLIANQDVDGVGFSASLELISYSELKFDVLGTGFSFLLNADATGASGVTALPVSLSFALGIRKYFPDFTLDNLPVSPTGIFEMFKTISGVSDEAMLFGAIQSFVNVPDYDSGPSGISLLANRISQETGIQVGPVATDPDVAVSQIIQRLGTASIPITVSEAIFETYIEDQDIDAAKFKTDILFKNIANVSATQVLIDLFTPKISASVSALVSLDIPRSILLPVKLDSQSNKYIVDPDPLVKARLDFAKALFTFSTQSGFGFVSEVSASLSASHPQVQLGNTGLRLRFTQAKIDLSDRTNIREAIVDNRPATFKGLYISEAEVYFSENWSVQGSPAIYAHDLLIGTGGVSGKFGVSSNSTNGVLFQATLFNDVSVGFSSFAFEFHKNAVASSSISGNLSIDSFKRNDGSTAVFAFTMLFGGDGYKLGFESVSNPVEVKLGTLGSVSFTRLSIGYEDGEWYLEVAAQVNLSASLPIVGKVLPKQINIKRLLLSTDSNKTALAVQPIWPDGTSVSGDIDTGLLITKTLNLVILDAIKVDLMRLAIARNQTTHTVSALATFDAALKLGNDSEFSTQSGSGQKPRGFLLQVQNIGFYVETEFKPEGGDVGPAELDVRFKLPDGVLVSVNAGGIVGGGSLAILENGNRYEGSIGLTFQDKINLGAFVILLKNLPNGQEGPSLLALISVSFQSNPIQLGLGFKLEGVGGLIGLHRTASIPVLRAGVSNGSLANLLFPANPAQDAAMILRTMDQAFPPAANRYTFGLMGKIAWGTPTLVTLDIGLIIEVPAPVRFILLGVLRAMLPNASSPIIRLRADFLGVIDFGAKKISFDAQLVDSKVLQFALSGNFAFRLYQGDDPVFLMTAGGFHPSFRPPANADLPTLQRLTLALAQGGDFRLTLTSYLAITTNTVQFGSKLDLYVNIGAGFSLQGFLGFDALFRFNPFYLEVRIGAGVAIKKGSRSMLSISLNLLVSGPAPWHVDGEGSFKILFFKIKFRVNRTFGGGASQPALPSTDVRQLLVAALTDASNWEVEPRAIKPANTVVLRTEDSISELVVDPGGVLAVHQRVVPLGYQIEVYGNTRPVNGNEFTITGVTMGSTTPLYRPGAGDLGEIREAFAPGQFRRMSDGEKLSAPSFQLMRSGLRIKSVDGLDGKEGVSRANVFEMKIFAPAPTVAGPVSNTNLARLTDETTSATSSNWVSSQLTVDQNFATDKLQRLAKMGAVGRTRRSHEQRRPSRTAPDQVLWSEDSYAIVSTRDLQPEEAAPNPFRTEAEATAYLQRLQAEDPSRVGELQVVPVYQLDVSAPTSIFNTATA